MSDARPRLQPPANDPPLQEAGGQHSQAWSGYFQNVADELTRQAAKRGVVDGSDATAGQVGEYLTAAGGAVGLSSNVPADIVAMVLTPGDWDVSGQAQFGMSLGVLEARCWVGLTSATVHTPGASVIVLVGGTTLLATNTQLMAGPVRFSVSAATNVYLGGLARFTAGSASAGGVISARRMR